MGRVKYGIDEQIEELANALLKDRDRPGGHQGDYLLDAGLKLRQKREMLAGSNPVLRSGFYHRVYNWRQPWLNSVHGEGGIPSRAGSRKFDPDEPDVVDLWSLF